LVRPYFKKLLRQVLKERELDHQDMESYINPKLNTKILELLEKLKENETEALLDDEFKNEIISETEKDSSLCDSKTSEVHSNEISNFQISSSLEMDLKLLAKEMKKEILSSIDQKISSIISKKAMKI